MDLQDLLNVVGCKKIVIKTDYEKIFEGCTDFVLDNSLYFEDCLYSKVRSIDPVFDKVRNESYLIITIC